MLFVNIWRKLISSFTTQIGYILIFSLLITSLNITTFVARSSGSAIIFFIEYIVQLSSNILLLFLLSFNNIILKIFSIILLLFSFLGFFTLHNYGIIVDEFLVASIFDNLDSFTSVNLNGAFIYLISLFLIFKLRLKKTPFLNKATVFCLSIVILFIFSISYNKNDIKNLFASYFPANSIGATMQYANKINLINKSIKEKISISNQYSFINKNKDNINIILIIGESARADHFGINGYSRNTNPLLKEIKNIISFRDVTPCSNNTRISIPCLLSHRSRIDFSIPIKELNIIDLFNSLNFDTSWYATQSAYGSGNLILQSAIQANTKKFKNSYRSSANLIENKLLDELVITDLRNIANNKKNQFIVLHTNGSHFPFTRFTPNEFINYKPVCLKKTHKDCSLNEFINMYDNTILYTDYFISEVIKSVKNTKSIVLYVSDHGSFLGEDGKYYHGNTSDYTNQAHKVPMIIWFSDIILQNTKYQKKFSNMKKRINDELSHDNIFHTILGCSNIESEAVDIKLNLCK
jgi:glucan phosphoethanolaminetransferase (alkaline phosphatase superfamily)